MYVSCFTGSSPGKVNEPEFNPSPPPLVPFGSGRLGVPHIERIFGFGPAPHGQVPAPEQPWSKLATPCGVSVATRKPGYVGLLVTDKLALLYPSTQFVVSTVGSHKYFSWPALMLALGTTRLTWV